MQPVDFTTLTAICTQIRSRFLPARIEQVYQRDRYTIALALRTVRERVWLSVSWHPQAARICIGTPPPRTPDTFTFSDQLRHQLNGLALIALEEIAPWERVIDLQFAKRPGEEALWHLYVEIMGKYSNVILTNGDRQIVTVAYQVNSSQSSLRTLQTGQSYQVPPMLLGYTPKASESQSSWQSRISLLPGQIRDRLVKTYQGMSPRVAKAIVKAAGLSGKEMTDSLFEEHWDKLFIYWQKWLCAIESNSFIPGRIANGYTVLPWDESDPTTDLQKLIDTYYTDNLQRESFKRLQHHLEGKINTFLNKSLQKVTIFQERLAESANADLYRQRADLLMAYLHQWQPGMKAIVVKDFITEAEVEIELNPEKNAVQNAQSLYKRHQKLKRAAQAVEPLLAEAQAEWNYLKEISSTLERLDDYGNSDDLEALEEIREELIEQKYLEGEKNRDRSPKQEFHPYRYLTPSELEIIVGRNNRQNDLLTFRMAGDYDLWFHTQEIPGSHVLLRLKPGSKPDEVELQFAADLAAYYSQGRQSDLVPVVCVEPKNLYKPKGAKPGMVIYKKERIIWGRPPFARAYIKNAI
jgi:predicted ribosome quality control (RQC) complex YloA/Tae2 family protein